MRVFLCHVFALSSVSIAFVVVVVVGLCSGQVLCKPGSMKAVCSIKIIISETFADCVVHFKYSRFVGRAYILKANQRTNYEPTFIAFNVIAPLFFRKMKAVESMPFIPSIEALHVYVVDKANDFGFSRHHRYMPQFFLRSANVTGSLTLEGTSRFDQ